MEAGEVRQSFMGSSRQQQHPSDQELMICTKMAVAQRGSCGSLVLVVVDANKVFTSTAVDWALDHVAKPGDSLMLLGILQHSTNMGYKSWTDDIHWNGASKKLVDSELSNKRQLLQSNLELHLKCKNLGVKLEIDVKSSINPRVLVVEEAKRLGAQHVVFDRGLKKDKKFYIENLTCFVTRVKGIDDVKHLHTGLLLPPVRSPDAEPPELPPRAAAEDQQALVASTNSKPDETHAEEQQQQQQQPHETISYNSTRHSHQRSSSSYMTCDLDESELLSIHDDEADTVEDKSSHGSSTPNNFEPIYSSNMDTMAVMQWLQEHGSPENSSVSSDFMLDELLQVSSSPGSGIVSPSTTASFGERLSSLPKLNLHASLPPVFSMRNQAAAAAELVSNSCSTSSVSVGSPPSPAPSLMMSMPRPVLTGASNISVLSSSSIPLYKPLSHNQAVGFQRDDVWTPVVDPAPVLRNAIWAQPGPISVQPRRADPRTLLDLDVLLNGDHRKLQLPERKVVKKIEAETEIISEQQQQQQHQLWAQELKQSPPTDATTLALTSNDVNPVAMQQAVTLDRTKWSVSPVGMHKNLANRTMSIRRVVNMRKQAPIAPPLCSVCNQKSPEFGKPVRRFTYAELQEATDNFNPNNYLAQGGYGSVFKGVLQEGQLIAVKQHKIASSQGDKEFCAEVEVLSCAQHRNLVTLIGYCVEDHLRLLVYEFVCNGSLDRHLSSKNKEVLLWKHRQKIALGAARGIRYLHEECRVGCIVHRDMRPNNILLTHDFTPMVGDFGLARRQFNGETAEETRVIGTFGYLAPEYAETGQITDKADVYAFGVVLLELITGRKAVDNSSNARGERCLTEWARPLLDRYASELVDPRLRISGYDDYEMHCMMHAASQCIKKDPTMRPRMTQVLRILDPSQDKDTPYGIGSRKATSDRPPFPPPTSNNGVTRTSRISPGSELDSNNEDQQPPLVQTGVWNQVPLPGRKSKSNRMRWKPERSSSAPRLSNDKGTSNKDITDVILKKTSLSYESMLDDV